LIDVVEQIIGRIIELNDVAERGQPINVESMMHDSWDDMDEVFAAPHLRLQHQQQQNLLHPSARLNTTVNSSAGVHAPANTSFDFRTTAAPPVQVRETTM